MLSGIFWFDDGPRLGLEGTIARAAAAYRHRFHREPTLCLVPPGMLRCGQSRLGSIAVLAHGALPPHQLWIGRERVR